MNSKRKGKVGELEAAHAVEAAWGMKVRRTAQVDGKLSSDLLLEHSTGDRVHLEVKRRKRIASQEFLDQAIRDAGEWKIPVVLSRSDRGDWALTIRLSDGLMFARWLVYAKDFKDGAQENKPSYRED